MKFVEISRRLSDLLFYFPMLLKNAFSISRLIKKEKIDLIHVNDIYNMLGLCVKIFIRTKVITHVRRMPESFPKAIYKTWSWLHIKFADRIVAVSEANKRGLPINNKTEVIYDSLPEIQKYNAYEIKDKLDGTIKILYLANYTDGKGHKHALYVLKRAIDEFPDREFYLNFYGGNFGLTKNNFYKNDLIALAKKLGISAFVCFNDKSSDVEKEMKAHDVIWNFSDSESFSRVTLEALFYSIPVIATDVGGTNEMLVNNKGGILVKAKSVEEMYAGFKRLISDDTWRVSMSKYGYDFVRTHFSIGNTSMKIKKIYQDV